MMPTSPTANLIVAHTDQLLTIFKTGLDRPSHPPFSANRMSLVRATGPAPAVEPSVLAAKGSLFLTRPTLVHYTRNREELETLAGSVLDLVASGVLKVRVEQRYALAEVAEAHRALEAGETLGATVFTP